MNDKPLITIVTVCYNAAVAIEETILSVLDQTYPKIEYIIIDGGSTDGTVDIIKKYTDRLAYWVSEPDKGIYDAMNKGIAAATGEYINFMNAGDKFYDKNVLSEFVPQINNEGDIIYGDVVYVLKKSRYRKKPLDLTYLSKGMVFCHQSTFIRTSFHKQHPYITTFKSAGDYKFLYDAYFVHKVAFQYIPMIVSLFDDTMGMSKDNYWLSHKEQLIIWNEQDSFRKKCRVIYNRIKYNIKNTLPNFVLQHIMRNK